MTQPPAATATLDTQQQAAFYAHMAAYQKDEVVGVLLALFLGTFGAHQFYLGNNGLGILYVLFFWTGIPTFLGWIECFFMPGRVRQHNAEQAIRACSMLAGGVYPAWVPAWGAPPAAGKFCGACSAVNPSTARFCSRCGREI